MRAVVASSRKSGANRIAQIYLRNMKSPYDGWRREQKFGWVGTVCLPQIIVFEAKLVAL